MRVALSTGNGVNSEEKVPQNSLTLVCYRVSLKKVCFFEICTYPPCNVSKSYFILKSSQNEANRAFFCVESFSREATGQVLGPFFGQIIPFS